ncbi:MAG: Ig-like domain repeat protein [Methanobrevibacter sp.]|nr:Ig-like domain repeat protein [Methanobrevibacter sp.]
MSKRLILVVTLIVIMSFAFNMVSATEIAEESNLELVDSSNSLELDSNDFDILNDENNNQDIFSSEDECIIYVGENQTENGHGTPEDPFADLSRACDYANAQNKEKVTVNIFSGTYTLGSVLRFNANNLFINGLDGEVIITDSLKEYTSSGFNINDIECLALTDATANFTISNIIFNWTDHFPSYFDDASGYMFYKQRFYPVLTNANLGIFNNCSFLAGVGQYVTEFYPYSFSPIFRNCYFKLVSDDIWYDDGWGGDILACHVGSPIKNAKGSITYIYEYCRLDLPSTVTRLYATETYNPNSYVNDVWFGSSNLPGYLVMQFDDNSGRYWRSVPVNRYAVFSVNLNYLGNNQFEILGKLTWNGTDDQDGMGNFQPMTVHLSSTTGTVDATAILKNGNFKAIYTRTSTDADEEDSVKVTLDQETKGLFFRAVDIEAVANPIVYGQEQNVALTFAQPVTGTLTISVNNKNYTVELEEDTETLTFTIPDTLPADKTHEVSIFFEDDTEHVYGLATADLTISKISNYKFNTNIPSEITFGQYATINVELPSDATGTVTVEAGNAKQTKDAAEKLSFDFGFNAGSYPVTVTYSGDDKYGAPEAVTKTITVKQAQSGLYMNDLSVEYADSISVPYTGNSIVGVNAVLLKDGVEIGTYKSTDGNIVLGNLAVGSYVVEATSIVTSNFLPSSAKINLNVTKAASTIDIADKTVNFGEDITITADTTNSVGDIVASVVDANNKAVVCNVSGNTIKLSGLDAGVYTVSVSTNVDANHNAATKTATLTVKKVEIPVSDNTVNVDVPAGTTSPSFDISLPADATGKLTVTVNGKEYTSDLVNGKATVNVNDLPAGDYAATVAYSGDAKYDPITKTTSISIPKATLTAKDVTMLYTAGSEYKVVLTRAGVPIAGENITIDINGAKYVRVSDENGTATLKLGLAPKTTAYTVTASTGDVKVSNKVTVNTILSAKNVSVKKSAKSLKVKVTLKKVNGKYLTNKKLTMKVNGKTITAKTNSKGVATFTVGKKIIKTFKAGKKYTYKVTYGADKISKKITVKK